MMQYFLVELRKNKLEHQKYLLMNLFVNNIKLHHLYISRL
ncbi:hypothetical protein LEP1GSC099_1392 [Leptospira interrogans str. UI 08452]|nr:hypothetical protein LEP1GSC099_1392 [Leptospira interrogans str. UI 08452]